MMASLTWKKSRKNVSSSAAKLFQNEDEEENEEEIIEDWRDIVPSKKSKVMLEDSVQKSKRLVNDATQLADEERYWEALQKFDEALSFTPLNEKIHEMKAQILLELGEIFPAVQAAEQVVKLNPTWAEGFQTLGRTQISIGEIDMALKSFCRAYHLNPTLDDLFEEDIKWARELLKQKEEMKKTEESKETERSNGEEEKCAKCHRCFKVNEKALSMNGNEEKKTEDEIPKT
ncbi:tetratricopeptide repeat protein 33-like [Clytia hemisphaerica]|uniref:Uncharacterized protein n=1 Tax=Clytia hemisphaerica TaxID=252671 RepID=A0A7M5UZ62_9CNID